MSFSDPVNFNEYIERIKKSPTSKEVLDVILEVFPTWIDLVLDGYSVDYSFLGRNWVAVCDKLKVEPKKIVLVKHLEFDEQHLLINTFAELMTYLGFCVRRTSEFAPCHVCGLAVPTIALFSKLREMRPVDVPLEWNSTCSACRERTEIKQIR
jgi:hypothetical protein